MLEVVVLGEPPPAELPDLAIEKILLQSGHALRLCGVDLLKVVLVLREHGLPLPLGGVDLGHLLLPPLLLQLVFLPHLRLERLPLDRLLVRDLLDQLLLRRDVSF